MSADLTHFSYEPGKVHLPLKQEHALIKWQTIGEQVPASGNRVTRVLGRAFLRVWGWSLHGEIPNRPQLIIAVAPHSSNLDFLLTVGVIWSLGLKASFLAKRSLFFFPLSYLMYAFGGIPVDRNSANGVVGDMTAHFENSPKLILGITPEGTRRRVKQMKSGFALIAQAANVPILPAIINYRGKIVTFKPLIEDVSNIEVAMTAMQAASKSGSPRRPYLG